ncbi:MAG: hypothetical protein ACJ77X_14995 [Chloroflexota bacterium]
MIDRSLEAAYARQRIEELVRGVLEDALSPACVVPARVDALPWDNDVSFQAELTAAVGDVTDATTALVAERLSMLLESAPPRLAGRLAAAPRFMERA